MLYYFYKNNFLLLQEIINMYVTGNRIALLMLQETEFHYLCYRKLSTCMLQGIELHYFVVFHCQLLHSLSIACLFISLATFIWIQVGSMIVVSNIIFHFFFAFWHCQKCLSTATSPLQSMATIPGINSMLGTTCSCD